MLVVAAVLAAAGCGFVTLAPNRLTSGAPVMLWHAAGAGWAGALATMAAALFVLGFAPARRAVNALAAAIAGAAVFATLAAAGAAAAPLAANASAMATVSLGAGFWVIAACAGLALIDALRRAEASAAVQLTVAAVAVAGYFALGEAGWFDALSLAREYMNRREIFAAAVLRHVELVAAAILPALAIGVPLGLLALRRKRVEAPLFAALNLLQTVPSIALFGLLIAPLSALGRGVPALGALGIGGVGPAPAIIALILYALLPVARNTLAGIGGACRPRRSMRRAAHGDDGRADLAGASRWPLALPVPLARRACASSSCRRSGSRWSPR